MLQIPGKPGTGSKVPWQILMCVIDDPLAQQAQHEAAWNKLWIMEMVDVGVLAQSSSHDGGPGQYYATEPSLLRLHGKDRDAMMATRLAKGAWVGCDQGHSIPGFAQADAFLPEDAHVVRRVHRRQMDNLDLISASGTSHLGILTVLD